MFWARTRKPIMSPGGKERVADRVPSFSGPNRVAWASV